ncbi:hypothetical protein M406DRAFT_344582 [Cryphonectria parasitica EP155]|uniref:DUF5672 domain-containing protein n=1 Tax=Cryphonectria parasitica (strain ATCC 38755 / EP155) TaxID=660469 RepID=A0A9P4YEB1_CRYP1|nr:uncharacterized protein M406DRAFT_344582 [Cryphonectria parasitica EP155]KAF3771326.1 hypothetical protein M406DRAFT_344582 [Cryphonectria parasitica EP155]
MAREPSPSMYAPPPTRARLRNKEYMFALFAAIFVSSSSSDDNSDDGREQAEGHSSSSNDAGGVAVPSPAYLTKYSPRAVIIESSIIPNLIPLMLHFTTILGPSWGIILFTLQDNWIEPLSPAFQRLKTSGHIEIRFLPADTELSNSHSVSVFLTSPWIWQQVELAKRVLLFQSDSILCAKSEAAVDDYFQYDFLGAPIAPMYGSGYNGGLSIRNPRMFLQIVRETDFATSGHEFEDQFFFAELEKRGAELPDQNVAKTFSVETIYYETPLGYHQPQRWQAAHMESIEDWCPEVKMLIGRRAQ